MNDRLKKSQQQFLAAGLREKSVMVSGATGLVGSQLVRSLMQLNDEEDARIKVIALYQNEQKRIKVFSGWQDRKDIVFVKCDIKEEIPYKEKVDYIVHGAGYSGGAKMHLKDPVGMFDVGVYGTKNMLDFAIQHTCNGFLYLSSYEVYGNNSFEGTIDEQRKCQVDPLSIRNLYAEIKMSSEALLCAYSAKYGLPVYAARLTSTFGSGVQYNDPRFFAEFARCILEGKDIVLKSAGKTVRSYLDVEDAASAFLYILTCGESGSAYNVTNMANEISIKDMARRMIELTGSPIRLITAEADHGEAAGFRKEGRTVMDAARLEALGWRPVCTLDETIRKMLSSMKDNEIPF